MAAAASAAAASADVSAPDTADVDVVRTLIEQDAALSQVAYALSLANRDLCLRDAVLPGFLVTSPVQYAPRYRDGYWAVTGLGTGFGAAAVVPGSPAAAAGLRSGDRIVAVAGKSLPVVNGGPARMEPINAVTDLLHGDGLDGVLDITIERGGVARRLAIHPLRGCAVSWQVTGGSQQQASTDGRFITVRSGLIAAAADPSELAYVVGHELAHALSYQQTGQLAGQKSGKRSGGSESRADVVGLYLAARAGFDPAAGARFMKRYARAHLLDTFFGGDHGSGEKRLRRLRDTAAEIVRRRQDNLELWPQRYPRPSGTVSRPD